MRRFLLGYVLIPAVLLATAGLAYYGYIYSAELAGRERQVILDTTRELAEEKILGIETEIIKPSTQLFDSVRLDKLLDIKSRIENDRLAIASVLVLDDTYRILPDGFHSKRDSADLTAFRQLFETRVVRDLGLDKLALNARGHLYRAYDGRPYLFQFTRRLDKGVPFFVVVEADLGYVFDTLFREYFGVRSPRLYQVVDENGDFRYGFDFAVPAAEVVELGFAETLTGWKLRVAQRHFGLGRARDTRRTVDLVLIGSAMLVILVGLGVLLVAERRERRANELKSDFISNVSHELKTPLSIISMFGEMLSMGRTKSPEQAAEYAGIIKRESVRLGRLIDNVLDFSKIERGVSVYEFAEGDLGEVVERSLDIYRHRIEREGIELSIEVEPDLPPVKLDENALTLALLNLVDNAIKYAAEGKRLEVSLRRRGDQVALAVRDYGPGIPVDERERIFERFYRARAVRLKPVRGSGIGLALVKHIAEAHGGAIEVQSEVGKGTTFTLAIPVIE